MSDDKVRLPDDVESAIEVYGDAVRRTCGDSGPEDYVALENASDALRRVIARTVADDDAREERIEKLRDEGFAMYAAHGDMTRDRDEWKARAERAEALLHDVEAALDNAGVARSTAPTVDACTDRDTPERYPRLAQADRVKVLAKSEKDILDRLLDADTATRKAEAERDSARALLREARGCVSSAKINAMGYCDTEERLADLLARIDAESAERDQGAVGDQTGGGK